MGQGNPKIGQTVPVGEVDYVDAFARDGATYTLARYFGGRVVVVPVVFGSDGEYHTTCWGIEKKMPSDTCVRVVGIVAVI